MTTKDEAREQLKELLWDVHHGRRQPLAALIDAEQFAAAACQPSTLEMLEALAKLTRGNATLVFESKGEILRLTVSCQSHWDFDAGVLIYSDGFNYRIDGIGFSRPEALALLEGGGG